MNSFHNILFPVDFSGSCRAIWPAVKAMAQRFEARVTLLHALPVFQPFHGGGEPFYPMLLDTEAMERDAQRELVSAFQLPDGLAPERVATHVESGDAAIAIVQFAEATGVDLIMMPTRGAGKFRSFLIGSVTAKVLHDATCAVWAAPHVEETEVAVRTDYKKILCAIDTDEEAKRLVTAARELSGALGAELRLVHASPPPKVIEQTAREEIDRIQRDLGTNLPVTTGTGAPAAVVRQTAEERAADLVIIGRGRMQRTFGRLRTNAYAIIRDAPCPVLSL